MPFELNIPHSISKQELHYLTELINKVYQLSEGNIWKDNYRRVDSKSLSTIIQKGELLIAKHNEEIVGCVQLEKRSDEVYGFKMLVADPNRRGEGIGSFLVKSLESRAIDLKAKVLKLELLVPTEFNHSDKEMLRSWYTNIGYQLQETKDINAIHQGIGEHLKTNCLVEIYSKTL